MRSNDEEDYKANFLNTVSHALRAPLTCISHSAQILSQEAIGPLNPKQQHYAHRILRKANAMQDRVNDLLELSLHQAGRVDLDARPCDFEACVREAIASRAPIAEEKAIALTFEPPSAAIQVLGDARRIVHVLENLLDNALRHTPPNGKVTIHITLDGPYLRCHVTDTGPGIAREAFPHLFTPFALALGAAQDGEGGLGIGLSVCKAIVERHGGTVGAESLEGSGSRFWFTLAIAP